MAAQGESRPDVIHVRHGEPVGSGSWLYVWVTTSNGRVIYVGGTGLSPDVRTWLHLHDPDPDIGRVAARYPGVMTEPVDVLLLRLPEQAQRPTARTALVRRLGQAGLLSDDYVGVAPADHDQGSPDSSLDELIAGFVGRVSAYPRAS